MWSPKLPDPVEAKVKVTVEYAVVLLAREARRLTVDMQTRLGRVPDIADYVNAFQRAVVAAQDATVVKR